MLPPEQTLTESQRLLDEGLPFHAHEVLEAAWKLAPPDERDLWKGLAQLAVGLTHHARGNTVGASRLLRRGAGLLAHAPTNRHRVPQQALSRWALEAADRWEAGDDSPPPPRLTHQG